MRIEISRDVNEYKSSVLLGLDSSQAIGAVVTVGVGIVSNVLMYFLTPLPLVAAVYITMPIIIVIGMLTLYKKHGKPLIRLIMEGGFFKKEIAYPYKSSESLEAIQNIQDKRERKETAEENDTVLTEADYDKGAMHVLFKTIKTTFKASKKKDKKEKAHGLNDKK